MKVWPTDPRVHSRDVEQRLLQLDTLLFRLEREMVFFPIGQLPISPNVVIPGAGGGIDPCVGEDPTKHFSPSRVFTFTMSGAPSTNFNRAWTLPHSSTGVWRQDVTVSGTNYAARVVLSGSNVQLLFSSLLTPVAGYVVAKCDFPIPGVALMNRSAGAGWPSTVSVTCT